MSDDNDSKWYEGTCEVCKEVKDLHIGYGQCYGCIVGAVEEPERVLCDSCNGAGEDRYEQTCRWCRGKGIEN